MWPPECSHENVVLCCLRVSKNDICIRHWTEEGLGDGGRVTFKTTPCPHRREPTLQSRQVGMLNGAQEQTANGFMALFVALWSFWSNGINTLFKSSGQMKCLGKGSRKRFLMVPWTPGCFRFPYSCMCGSPSLKCHSLPCPPNESSDLSRNSWRALFFFLAFPLGIWLLYPCFHDCTLSIYGC